MLNIQGGIIDDLMITKVAPDEFYVVTNATRRKEDIEHMRANMEGRIVQHVLIDNGLLALQGPKAAETLQKLTTFDLTSLKFNDTANVTVLGTDVFVARG